MFPINFNFPYRKKDGSLITMEKALDGAGANLDLIDLDDVAISSPAEGDGLIYDNTAHKWKNKPVVTGDLWAENGAHNLLPNELTTQVQDEVTLTVNADKTITATSSSSTTTGIAVTIGTFDIKAGDYTLSGSPSGSASNTYYLQLYKNGVIDKKAFENELTFNVASDISNVTVRLVVEPNVNIGNKTFKPMLRLASDTDTTYAPYAKTNRELTEVKVGTVTAESGYSFVTGYDNKAYRSINTVFVNLKVTQFTPSSTAWVNIATLPTGFRPTNQVFFPVMDDKQGIAVSGRIDTNGKVYVWGTANTAILPFVNTTYIVS